MAALIAWVCDVCKAAMTTFLPQHDGPMWSKTKQFPAVCASCGAVRMLAVAENQPLVDIKTEAVRLE